uniref:Uncharacterized protein n=1 Tax=Nelumbo nucifera TaxID=4432 RepID=A0A822YQ64_NELNU|nr:TPA_asm: hypothetical protein HUJ06_012602 [Nelumbo nucifera]
MKLVGVSTLVLLHSCVAAALIVLIFCLSPSISQHFSVIVSTFALVTTVKASPVFGFCICNLIIVAILLGSTRPSEGESDWFGSLHPSVIVVHEREEERQEMNSDDDKVAGDNSKYSDNDNADFRGYDGYDEGRDDLEKRIEEFIAKINKEWRAEWLREKLLSIGAVQEHGFEV